MKFVGLVSGGKDSIFAIQCCLELGHELQALAHLQPKDGRVETDSYMYQSVCSSAVPLIAQAIDVPLVLHRIQGEVVNSELRYDVAATGDEVEDLYELLAKCKDAYPNVKGVSCGAILSNYQRMRVENICDRLDLIPLAPLWRQAQRPLLDAMVSSGIDALIVKTASMGLDRRHLGKSIAELQSYFESLEDQFGFFVCGEGGEYETLTVDAPLFKKRLKVREWDIHIHSEDPFSPVLLLIPRNITLEDKTKNFPQNSVQLAKDECDGIVDAMQLSSQPVENFLSDGVCDGDQNFSSHQRVVGAASLKRVLSNDYYIIDLGIESSRFWTYSHLQGADMECMSSDTIAVGADVERASSDSQDSHTSDVGGEVIVKDVELGCRSLQLVETFRGVDELVRNRRRKVLALDVVVNSDGVLSLTDVDASISTVWSATLPARRWCMSSLPAFIGARVAIFTRCSVDLTIRSSTSLSISTWLPAQQKPYLSLSVTCTPTAATSSEGNTAANHTMFKSVFLSDHNGIVPHSMELPEAGKLQKFFPGGSRGQYLAEICFAFRSIINSLEDIRGVVPGNDNTSLMMSHMIIYLEKDEGVPEGHVAVSDDRNDHISCSEAENAVRRLLHANSKRETLLGSCWGLLPCDGEEATDNDDEKHELSECTAGRKDASDAFIPLVTAVEIPASREPGCVRIWPAVAPARSSERNSLRTVRGPDLYANDCEVQLTRILDGERDLSVLVMIEVRIASSWEAGGGRVLGGPVAAVVAATVDAQVQCMIPEVLAGGMHIKAFYRSDGADPAAASESEVQSMFGISRTQTASSYAQLHALLIPVRRFCNPLTSLLLVVS